MDKVNVGRGVLPPLSLAQGTQGLAAEALKTAIKTPLMDGSRVGERMVKRRAGGALTLES